MLTCKKVLLLLLLLLPAAQHRFEAGETATGTTPGGASEMWWSKNPSSPAQPRFRVGWGIDNRGQNLGEMLARWR